MNHFSLASALACAIFTAQVFAASPTIKVDFDMSGRQSAEVTEPNFTRWMVSGVSSKIQQLVASKSTLQKEVSAQIFGALIIKSQCNRPIMRALSATA